MQSSWQLYDQNRGGAHLVCDQRWVIMGKSNLFNEAVENMHDVSTSLVVLGNELPVVLPQEEDGTGKQGAPSKKRAQKRGVHDSAHIHVNG